MFASWPLAKKKKHIQFRKSSLFDGSCCVKLEGELCFLKAVCVYRDFQGLAFDARIAA